MKKRKHHYVWRHHLRAWCTNEQIWCKHNDRLFLSNVENVAQERDFYKLKELSNEDIGFIRQFVSVISPDRTSERHEHWIETFIAIQKRRTLGRLLGISDSDFWRLIEEHEHNLDEDIHGSIETAGMTGLSHMRAGDLSFYEDDDKCIMLMHYLSTQFYRTNCMKQRVLGSNGIVPKHLSSMETVWSALSHMLAADFGASLYRNRKQLRPSIVRTDGSANLITGDQPIINTHETAGGMKHAHPTHLDLYYPLGPTSAFFLRETSTPPSRTENTLIKSDINFYNDQIAKNSFAQLYGATYNDLATRRSRGLQES